MMFEPKKTWKVEEYWNEVCSRPHNDAPTIPLLVGRESKEERDGRASRGGLSSDGDR
jgi:hypothetical protein